MADTLSRCFTMVEVQPRVQEKEEKILNTIHEKLAHPGVRIVKETLRPYMRIPKLEQKYSRIRANCKTCQKFLRTSKKYGKVGKGLSTKTPFKDISSDIYGPVPCQKFRDDDQESKFYILTITDRATRWTECFHLKTLQPKEVVKHFEKWIRNNSSPETLLTDQGRTYLSEEFTRYIKAKQIQPIRTSPYNPTGNSISERLNQTITRVLQVSEPTTIKKIISKINYVLQNQNHRTLDASPFELCKRRSNFDPEKRELPGFSNHHLEKLDKAAKVSEDRLNRGRVPYTYRVGEKVYKQVQRAGKLDPYWEGPFIIRKLSDTQDTCVLENETRRVTTNSKQIRPIRGGQDVSQNPN